jgi:hypothetical protein
MDTEASLTVARSDTTTGLPERSRIGCAFYKWSQEKPYFFFKKALIELFQERSMVHKCVFVAKIIDKFILWPYFFLAYNRADLKHLKKKKKKETKLNSVRPNYRRLSAKLAPTFADRGCHVVSVTDPYGRILGFLDRDLKHHAREMSEYGMSF